MSSDWPAAVRNHRGWHASGFLYSCFHLRRQVFTDRLPVRFDKFSLWTVHRGNRPGAASPRGSLPIFYLCINRGVELWPWQATRGPHNRPGAIRMPKRHPHRSPAPGPIPRSLQANVKIRTMTRLTVVEWRVAPEHAHPPECPDPVKAHRSALRQVSASCEDHGTVQPPGHRSDQMKSLWRTHAVSDASADTAARIDKLSRDGDTTTMSARRVPCICAARRRMREAMSAEVFTPRTMFGFSSYLPVDDDPRLDR